MVYIATQRKKYPEKSTEVLNNKLLEMARLKRNGSSENSGVDGQSGIGWLSEPACKKWKCVVA